MHYDVTINFIDKLKMNFTRNTKQIVLFKLLLLFDHNKPSS